MNYQQRAKELLNGRSLIFHASQGQIQQNDPVLWSRLVETAVEFGGTHVQVGYFPYKYGTQFLPDNVDPYAAWCNCTFGLLWAFPPEALREWITPADYEWRQEYIAKQIADLRRHGLKATVDGIEPLWLPEGVYRAHPAWRGPQCELARIARRPYFTPSIDEPEVLDLYREAVREMCKLFPEIELLSFMSNDSGGGISWTPNTYPGMNGPLKWRTRDPGARIAGWLSALQEGAKGSGVEAKVHIFSSGLSAEIQSSTRRQLGPGQYLNWTGNENAAWSGGGANLGGGVWGTSYPAAGLADPPQFVAGLQHVFNNPNADTQRVTISFDATHVDRARQIMSKYLAEGEKGSVSRARVALAVASDIAGGTDEGEELLNIWSAIEKATHAVAQIRQKGFGLVLPFCGVSMRWITRPLVPKPELLTDEETESYRHHLFSVNNPEENASFSFVLGKAVFQGESVMWMARWSLEEAYGTLQGASKGLKQLAAKAQGDVQKSLSLEAARVGAFACLVKNAQNVIRFQYALDVSHHPQYGWNVMDYDENILYDQRALQLRKIAREEVDNTQALIEHIESQSELVLVHAASTEGESVFLLGPDIVRDLKQKMNVMLDHWHDYEELFPSTKVWELEPQSKDVDSRS